MSVKIIHLPKPRCYFSLGTLWTKVVILNGQLANNDVRSDLPVQFKEAFQREMYDVIEIEGQFE
jgi:hypothetical protein